MAGRGKDGATRPGPLQDPARVVTGPQSEPDRSQGLACPGPMGPTARASADKFVHRLSLWVGNHWLETKGILTGIAVAGGALAWLVGDGWNSTSIFETCFAVVLAIGIFTWTLAGFSVREADRRRLAAEEFAAKVEGRPFGRGALDSWHREELARVLRVEQDQVEGELLLWLIDKSGKQGPREALVLTQRLWFLRLVGRGPRGKQVFDLATGERL